MATHIGIGISQNIDVPQAALEAATQARLQTNHPKSDLAIVFNTVHYNPEEFLPIIQENLKGAKIVGCSTAGVITSEIIGLRALAVLTIVSDDNHFALTYVDNVTSENLVEAGKTMAKQSVENFGRQARKAFLYFADGMLEDHSLVLKGLQEVFGNIFPIVGAGSCDDFHFKQTHQYCFDKVMANSVTGILMGGRSNVGVGSRHGWRPLGKPRTIDKVEGNIILTIDGKPASKIYDEYFKEKAMPLRTTRLGHMAILYPLGIYIKGEREYLLRNAVQIRDDGSIICQGDVPHNSEVHIMLSNTDSCIQAAADAAIEAQSNLRGKKAQLVIIIESMARHKLLGRSAQREIETIKEIFGHSTPIIGMYSYGEIAPSQLKGDKTKTHLQNESITILAIG